MKALRITACRDRSWWYAGLVGKLVPLLAVIPEGYLSREPAGYSNVVKACEAEVVEVAGDCINCANEHCNIRAKAHLN